MGVTRWIARLFSLTQSIVPTRQVIGHDDRIQTLHSRIPWGLDCPWPHGGPYSIDRMVSYWDLHWLKGDVHRSMPLMNFAPSAWMMTNRILTGYCPLGSGSGPIGALLMGSRMNGYNISYSP